MNKKKFDFVSQKIMSTESYYQTWHVLNREMKLNRPFVLRPASNGLIKRGKGWSRGEIMEAGIDPKLMKKIGFAIDHRRKTVHKMNVEALKELKSIPKF